MNQAIMWFVLGCFGETYLPRMKQTLNYYLQLAKEHFPGGGGGKSALGVYN